MVAKFNISNTIDDALRLVGYDVYSTQLRDTGSPLDLDGYSVFDKAGDCWGTVIGLSLSGPLRILEVQSEDGVIMVPFEDAIVVEVDEKERKILLDPPEGLRDLN